MNLKIDKNMNDIKGGEIIKYEVSYTYRFLNKTQERQRKLKKIKNKIDERNKR